MEKIAKEICKLTILQIKVGGIQEDEDTVNKRVEANWENWKNFYIPLTEKILLKINQIEKINIDGDK